MCDWEGKAEKNGGNWREKEKVRTEKRRNNRFLMIKTGMRKELFGQSLTCILFPAPARRI
jgi:hypothetical protein